MTAAEALEVPDRAARRDRKERKIERESIQHGIND